LYIEGQEYIPALYKKEIITISDDERGRCVLDAPNCCYNVNILSSPVTGSNGANIHLLYEKERVKISPILDDT
jgi:hypothetical protein